MIARHSVQIPTEHQEQVAVVQWWAYEAKRRGVPEFSLFAIPNGGGRSKVGGALLKSEGVRPGVADLFLAVPYGICGGLFIEMKRRQGGRESPVQVEFAAYAREAGYAVTLCEGADEAIEAITGYLDRP